MHAANFEQEIPTRILILKKALNYLPDSPTIWKELIELVNENEARTLLHKAVECIPENRDMWLALAKLETLDNARVILNRAR